MESLNATKLTVNASVNPTLALKGAASVRKAFGAWTNATTLVASRVSAM